MGTIADDIDILGEDISYLDPDLLKLLLQDKTTKQNILLATDDYTDFGDDFKETDMITPSQITGLFRVAIQPRAAKSKAVQDMRIKKRKELNFMLYLMRHGQTDWNIFRKLQGQTDIPLNDNGRQMARAAARQYTDMHFDVCYCSPLSRAIETAEIFFDGRNTPIIKDNRLIEMGFGIYEGAEKTFDIPDCPINELFYHLENYKPVENGESLEALFARTGEFLKSEAKPHLDKGENVLIVGHGVMNCSIICQVRELPLEQFWSVHMENCKLIEV